MAILNAWQRLDRVVSGKPFGDGSDGAYSSATIPTMKVKTCAGTAESTTLTADTDATPFAVGDILLIHQTRGTGAGQWEINKVDAVGTDEYTLNKALNYTYTDSGASQAQAVKIPQYTNVTVESGTWTLASWDGDINGILTFAANGTLTITGSIIGSGTNGVQANAGSDCIGGGFYGGRGGGDAQRYAGEGTSGGVVAQTTANGNGGGGGDAYSSGGAGGGGGANGTAGTNGGTVGAGGTVGVGGGTSGSADLITMTFGGGGGGGSSTDTGGQGGSGAGLVAIFTKDIASINAITLTGGHGGDGAGSLDVQGGSAGGGSALVVCQTATLGATKITALGQAGGFGGGNGGNGRIAIHHSGAITGTSNPTFTDVEDATLVETGGGNFFAIL